MILPGWILLIPLGLLLLGAIWAARKLAKDLEYCIIESSKITARERAELASLRAEVARLKDQK